MMNTTLKLNDKYTQGFSPHAEGFTTTTAIGDNSHAKGNTQYNLSQEEVTKFNGFVSQPGFGCRTQKCQNREATYGDIFLPFCNDVDSCMKKNLEYLILENVRQKGVIEALSNVMTINEYDFDTRMDISDDEDTNTRMDISDDEDTNTRMDISDDELDEDTNTRMDISQEIQQTL